MRFYTTKLLLFAVIAITFSCSNDDGPAANNEIELASGTYSLTEININPAQNVNGDGNTTTNVVTELPCATGTLLLSSNATWTWNFVNIQVTAITGGLYNIACTSSSTSRSGSWQASSSQITLFDGANTFIFSRNDTELTQNLSEDLPEFRSLVYVKQ